MRYILVVLTLFLFMGCDKDIEIINSNTSSSDKPQEGNKKPVANAGPDKTVSVGKSVKINGGGTDEDGKIVYYIWKEYKEVISESQNISYSSEKVGEHILTLTVVDDDGATDEATMKVTVTK